MRNIFEKILQLSEASVFSHRVECHRFLRCLADTQLADMELRQDRDYLRHDDPTYLDDMISINVFNSISRADDEILALIDTYLFKRPEDALVFRLWIPQQDGEDWEKAWKTGLKQIKVGINRLYGQKMTAPTAQIFKLKIPWSFHDADFS